jgi:hypothetical protein
MTKFVLTEEYRYWWPIEVKLPDPDRAGEFVTQKFKMEFLAMPSDEARALTKEIDALPAEQREEREHEHLMRVARNWNEDVVDADKKPVRFSKEALAQALRFPWFRAAVYRGYTRSLVGDEARKGN